jgi:trehalose 6-phosphate synthase/phosphatase
MASNRLLIVSNRLPVVARRTAHGPQLQRSSGGLASGLRRWHEQSDGLWIGWPGDLSWCSSAQRADLDRRFTERGIVPVQLSAEQIDRYYHGFANCVLWPLFHYLIDRVPVDAAGWHAYRDANEAFADVLSRHYRAGDTIWIHDYQLMLLPALLRQRLPGARIGFFLHIPFPSSEVFRTLPWRREILAGVLGADVVGFHTHAYLRHFVGSLLHVDGVEVEVDRVSLGDREVRLGAFPMGVDAEEFGRIAVDPRVREEAAALRRDAGDRRIVLGIDRLDYTKGIPRRLEAVKRLLMEEPALADQIRYIQVAVPSRGEVDSYRQFKRGVEQSVGQINGSFGTRRSTPVHYVHRSVSMQQLVALYCAADVMLVTPLRDGMNLVAKEFVASRVDEDGVLVLSEFAGAAAELEGALVVNPYDVDGMAGSIRRALQMPQAERAARMKRMRQRVLGHDIHVWARRFLDELTAARPAAAEVETGREPGLLGMFASARRSGKLRLLLDYDGTLVPITRSPELATPDLELLTLLGDLAKRPQDSVEIVSGRPRETLEAWFGQLPVALWAEHGFWFRRRPGESWQPAASMPPQWLDRIMPILEQFRAATPGSRIEVKSASVAWHYRGADREFGARQAHELRMLLGETLSNQPMEVLEGKKVIEIRLRGVSKARVAHGVDDAEWTGTTVVAIGDDATDEELFRALPASGMTVAVGGRPSRARYRVEDYRAVRDILRLLASPTEEHEEASAMETPARPDLALKNS